MFYDLRTYCLKFLKLIFKVFIEYYKKILKYKKSFDMRLIFYIFFFSQIFNFLGVIAEKVNQDPHTLNRVDWEKVPKKKIYSFEKDYLEIL